MSAWRRALRFYVVGAGGATIQLLSVAGFVHGLGVHYGVATAIAIGVALVHNFIWHARWTWRDRRPRYLAAFAQFVAANGGVSIAGSAVVVPLLVEGLGLPPVAANAAAIVTCGLLNFWLASRVFRTSGVVSLLPVVPELQLDAEVARPQKADRVLEFVFRRR